MTGDIRERLLASDAIQSLEMEARTAAAFRVRGWSSEQGAYYSDPITSKFREIDVLVGKTFHEPSLSRLDDPVVNLRIICECKSLGGDHVVFYEPPLHEEEDPTLSYFLQTRVPWIWLGYDLETVIDVVGDTLLKGMPLSRRSLLRQYLVDRAFPDQTTVWGQSHLVPPPIDITATAFRETNSKTTRDETSSVVWKSILGLFSTYEAMRLHEV
jgi:hypothetical protein